MNIEGMPAANIGQSADVKPAALRRDDASKNMEANMDNEGDLTYKPEDLIKAVEKISELTDLQALGVSISIENDISAKFVIKLIDRETEEVIRQIPNEDIINLSRKLSELFESNQVGESKGLVLNDKA